MKLLSTICASILLGSAVTLADIVYLNDGTQIEGQVKKTSDGLVITTPKGIEITVKPESVLRIEVGRSTVADPNAGAKERLASLRSVADTMPDIHQIISRYEKFISQNTGSPILDDANKDLLVWHDRLDKGLVKLAGKWITPQERETIEISSQGLALQARDLLRQNRMKEADPILQQALADDPQSATALYLRGVMLYKQDQLEKAKKSFEAANDAAPNNAPILNNLAVISWRQKSFVAAMNYYDLAMLASPQTRQVLDNVAEALHALPDEIKQAAAVKKCAVDFQDQDTALQAAAGAAGWFRWGSTWVTAKQLDELKAAEAKIKEQLDALNKEGDDTRAKLVQIGADMDANQRQMDLMQASSIRYDANGNQYQLPLPAIYYKLQRDNAQLAGDKQTAQAHFDDLKVKYKQVEASAPVPRFSGNQKIVDIDAAPVRAAATPDPAQPTLPLPVSPALPSGVKAFPATQP